MKTVLILGAGSTAKLGAPTTNAQIGLFEKIGESSDDPALLVRLKEICNKKFGVAKKKEGDEESYPFSVNDIFNLLDSNLLLHNGIYTEHVKLDVFELEQCKRELIAFLFRSFQRNIRGRDRALYEQYVNFYAELARREIRRKKSMFGEHTPARDAFIASYSVVNFNWDLYSLLPIIEAHSRVNRSGANYLPFARNPQLRIFTDFQCEYGGRGDDKLWYPFTESAAFQVNSEKHDSLRRVITVKCIYPHGGMNLFKCPGCSKHSYFLGDLTIDSVNDALEFKKDSRDTYKCPYCGHRIGGFDFDILPQSNFKVRNSFLEETRLSMISEVQNADRLVFIGYSMPEDDVDFRTLFKGLCTKKKDIFVLLKGDADSGNAFVSFEELCPRDKQRDEVRRFQDTFGHPGANHQLFFNMSGAPEAFRTVVDVV